MNHRKFLVSTIVLLLLVTLFRLSAKAQDGAIKPYFITNSTFDEAKLLKKMGITLERFQALNDDVCSTIYWDRILQQIDQDKKSTSEEKLMGLSRRIRKIVGDFCTKQDLDTHPRLLKQWLFAKACCAYVVSNLDYDWDLVSLPNQERKARSTSERILEQPAGKRKAICVGFSILPRDMVRIAGGDLGIKSNFVGSFSRELGKDASEFSNHAFVCFELDEGINVPAELTTPRMKRKDFQSRCTAPREDYVMPFTPEARELFMARNYGADETRQGDTNMGDIQNAYKFCKLSLNEWKAANTTYLKQLDHWIMHQFDARAKGVSVQ